MSGPKPASTAELKAALRRVVMARRRAAHADRAAAAAAMLSLRALAELPFKGKIIAGYWPLGDEIDCRPALEALIGGGAQIVLPVVAGQGQALVFRLWKVGEKLDPGPFGTAHPSVRAAVLKPDILLLPLIGFDPTGHRLGYGAGYYDRTVEALRRERSILAVGVAYDEQEVDAVPLDDHDQPMDAVMTDRRTLWFNKALKP